MGRTLFLSLIALVVLSFSILFITSCQKDIEGSQWEPVIAAPLLNNFEVNLEEIIDARIEDFLTQLVRIGVPDKVLFFKDFVSFNNLDADTMLSKFSPEIADNIIGITNNTITNDSTILHTFSSILNYSKTNSYTSFITLYDVTIDIIDKISPSIIDNFNSQYLQNIEINSSIITDFPIASITDISTNIIYVDLIYNIKNYLPVSIILSVTVKDSKFPTAQPYSFFNKIPFLENDSLEGAIFVGDLKYSTDRPSSDITLAEFIKKDKLTLDIIGGTTVNLSLRGLALYIAKNITLSISVKSKIKL